MRRALACFDGAVVIVVQDAKWLLSVVRSMSPPDPPSGRVFTYRLDPEETVTHGVAKAVAVVVDSPPSELDTLHSVIDPDALDSLFQPTAYEDAHVRFQFMGCQVWVYSDRVIEVRPTD